MSTILSKEEIDIENGRMFLKNDTLVSLISYPNSISAKKLKELISKDSLPKTDIDPIHLKNRNIKDLCENITIKKAILINKSTLRYLPTKFSFYSSIIKEDNIATELSFATPILVLHESLDKEWLYIQSYYYRGWILKEDISYLDESTFHNFYAPHDFIIITENILNINNISIDMGVKLPLLAKHEEFYEVLIPTINNTKIIKISNDLASIGYLDYTKENILNQAKKYLNTPYKWGGINNGIDCSLLIVNIFKTFGLLYPRDTKEQENTIGLQKINLKGKTEEEKKLVIAEVNKPALLYKPGHVLLLIEENTVLHAYGDAQKVCISKIDNSYGTNLYPYLTTIICLYRHLDC